MKRIITYLIVAAATLYTAIIYGSTSFLMLFYMEMVLPLVLFAACIPLLRGLWVQLQLPIPVAERGKGTPVDFVLENRASCPSGRVAVQVTCYFPMNQKPEKHGFMVGWQLGSGCRPHRVSSTQSTLPDVWAV